MNGEGDSFRCSHLAMPMAFAMQNPRADDSLTSENGLTQFQKIIAIYLQFRQFVA